MWSAVRYFAFTIAAFRKYEPADEMIMTTRITKIHTSSWTFTSGSCTARRMKEISATPVTPYVSNPSALGPTESPALSPVQSAMTPGLRASSSPTDDAGVARVVFLDLEHDLHQVGADED